MRTSRRRRRRTSRHSVRRNAKYYTPPWYKSAPAAIKHRRPSWLGGLRSGWKRGEGDGQRIYEFPNGRGASVIPYRVYRGGPQDGWELVPLSYATGVGELDYSIREITPYHGAVFIGDSEQVNRALDFIEQKWAPWAMTAKGRAWGEGYMNKNAKRPKMSELGVFSSVGVVRAARTSEQLGFMPPGLVKEIRKLPGGLYKYGYGKNGPALKKFPKAGLRGAMTSTRIAASATGEPHWLIDTSEPQYPVVIRIVDQRGKTAYRVEEYAERFVEVPVLVRWSRAASGSR